MYKFDFLSANSIDEATQQFEASEDATYIAGGMTLVPTLKQRLAMPSHVVDLSKIESLQGISVEGERLVVGAMTSHAQITASDVVQANVPALAGLAGEIGDASVRNRGTIGGSLANSDPSADYPAAVLALGADIVTNKRTISANDYFLDLFETALDEGEIITQIVFPTCQSANYQKFSNPASRYAVVGVFIAKMPDGVRVAITGAGPCAFRMEGIEKALEANFSTSAVGGVEVSSENLNEDIHATADYRASLITTLAERAVKALS